MDVFTNRLTLEGLYLLELARGFFHYRSPRRRQARRSRVAFNEQAWHEAASDLGRSCHPLGSGIFEIRLEGARTRVIDYTSAIDDPVTCALLHDKPVTHRILADEGLPVPRHACFTLQDVGPGIAFLESMGCECVIKPARGTGAGRGVSCGIRRRSHLARAAAAASVYCDDLLIEQQIKGDNYRLLYLDGELIDAFVRRPPVVIGDGRSTVAGLVCAENANRLQHGSEVSQVLLPFDFDMRRTLAKQSLSLRSVPAAGTIVTLKTVINDNSAADNSTATDLLCDSIIEEGARAVRALGVRFAGIDVITVDPGLPLAESGGVILEANGTPGLYYHYHKRDGAFPAALHVLRRLLVEQPLTPGGPGRARREIHEGARV